MRAVIQRVSSASVNIEGKITSKIGIGLLVLVGIEAEDSDNDMNWLSQKIVQLRIFNDHAGRMNLSILDVQGDILLVSQFTLHANVKKGNRPSFIRAAKPNIAIPIYEKFKEMLSIKLGKQIFEGSFGAHMKVSLINDGPVTILIDTKNRA